jgi:uncharacterized RDD family membrane protein YckC
MVGHYAGHVRAVAVRDGAVWAFFEDGLYRLYPVSDEAREAKGSESPSAGTSGGPDGATGGPGRVGEVGGTTRPAEMVPAERLALRSARARRRAASQSSMTLRGAPGDAGKLPFAWTPCFACTDDREGLWVVGLSEGRITVARLAKDGPSTWQTSFPPGPEVAERSQEEAAGDRGESGAVSVEGSLRDGVKAERLSGSEGASERGLTVRAHATKDLYVFWLVRKTGGDSTNAVCGARLHHSSRDPTLPGAWWEELSGLEMPDERTIDDFCVASADGELGIVTRCRVPGLGARMRERAFHSRLVSRDEWSTPSRVPGTSEAFRFGEIAGMSWARWGAGGLLVSSNTQRARIVEYGLVQEGAGPRVGEWRLHRPEYWILAYLPEIQVMALFAGALLLVLTGCGMFLTRLRRLRKRSPLPYGPVGSTTLTGRPGAAGLAMPTEPPGAAAEWGEALAPLSARVFAAVLDLVFVSGLVVMLPGAYEPPPSPVLPGMAPLMRHLLTLAILVVYGTAMETAAGATLGKMLLGLRVIHRSSDGNDTQGLGFGRALVRNLFRFIDTGPIGLAVIAMTAARRRFGDMAADTIVVVTRERTSEEGEGS